MGILPPSSLLKASEAASYLSLHPAFCPGGSAGLSSCRDTKCLPEYKRSLTNTVFFVFTVEVELALVSSPGHDQFFLFFSWCRKFCWTLLMRNIIFTVALLLSTHTFIPAKALTSAFCFQPVANLQSAAIKCALTAEGREIIAPDTGLPYQSKGRKTLLIDSEWAPCGQTLVLQMCCRF